MRRLRILMWLLGVTAGVSPTTTWAAPDAATPSAEQVQAQVTPRKVNVYVEPKQVAFAQPFHLVVQFERAKGEHFKLPSTLPQSKSVRATGRPSHDVKPLPVETDGDVAWVQETFRIPMLALDLDEAKTPALVLTSTLGQTLDVPALKADVVDPGAPAASNPKPTPGQPQDAPPAPPSFAKPDGPQMFRVDDWRPWWSLLMLVMGGLAYALQRWLRRWRVLVVPSNDEQVTTSSRADTTPAHVRALERLEALLAEGLLKRGEVEPFVTRLMDDVLRDYLAGRFGLHAEQATTAELARELLDVGHARLDISLVQSLLEDVDMVKFAKATMQVEVASQMAGKVRTLTVDTQPVDDVTGENAEKGEAS